MIFFYKWGWLNYPDMDSFLKPARFNTDPESPQAAEEWLHWHTTLDNFIDSAKVEDDAEKFKLLINFIGLYFLLR